MTDRKFSLLRKEQQWVLCCGKDIIWLVGERTDNRFRIDSSTQRVLIIHIIKKKTVTPILFIQDMKRRLYLKYKFPL